MSTKDARTIVRFGPYEADFAQGELRKHGTRLKIQGKPLAILELLVRRQGEIVSRQELRTALWAEDVFVDFEKNLSTAVNNLRVVLSDSAESPRYIETIPRRGYRFLVPVEICGTAGESPSGPEPRVGVQAGASTEHVVPRFDSRPGGNGIHTAAELPGPPPVPPAAEKPKNSLPLPRHRLFWAGVAVGSAAVVIFALVSAFSSNRNKLKLKEADTIVLADFENSTGDAVFDNALRQGLASQLEQSPFLNLLSDGRVRQTMALMAKPKDAVLTPEVAREVCQRAGSKAYVAGAIASLSNEYILQVRAVNCGSGETLAEEQVTAKSKNQVVSALGQAATSLRTELGESLATVQKFDLPLQEATTPSLDALKAFSLGEKAAHTQGAAQSLPYDHQAIAIDPNFAMAYEAVGIHYSNLGEPSRAAEYLTKAFSLRDHASQRERLKIQAFYYSSVSGELEKAATSYQEMIGSYPRDIAAYNNLGIVLAEQGQYERAVEVTKQGMHVAPEEVTLDENLTNYLLALQRFDEARKIIREMQPKKPDNYIFPAARYALGFLSSDSEAMSEQEQWFAKRPAYENFCLALASDTAAYGGQLGQARQLTKRAISSAVQADTRETAALWQAIAAQREAAYGFRAEARRAATEALHLDPTSQGTEAEAALAFALAGDAAHSEPLARDLNKKFPLDTQMQDQWLPAIYGQLDLDRNDAALALKTLQAGPTPVEFGTVAFAANANGSCLYPIFVRGQAYLAAGQGQAAAAEFQKIVDHGGIVWNCWTGALARLGVARANALEAKTLQGADADAARVRARAAYEEFFGRWKNADRGIPVLNEAKAEYAKLR